MINPKILFATLKNFYNVRKFDPHSKYIDPIKIKLKIQQKQIILAVLNKQIIGILKFSYFWDTRPYMDLIYVDPDYRKEGIGKSLLNFLEDYLVREGYFYLFSSSEEPEKTPQQWHKKMGFQECGVIDKINLPHNKNREIFFFKRIVKKQSDKEELKQYPLF